MSVEEFRLEKLKNLIDDKGFILLNPNIYCPNLMDTNESWETIIPLIKQGDVFYSKFYCKKVTFLSNEFYFKIKSLMNSFSDSLLQLEIIDLLKSSKGLNSECIKKALCLSNKEFTYNLNFLLQTLQVTVLDQSSVINPNWSSFIWGTSKQWEKLKVKRTFSNMDLVDENNNIKSIELKLSRWMPSKIIKNFIKKLEVKK